MFLSNLTSVCARKGTLGNQRLFALGFRVCMCKHACMAYLQVCVCMLCLSQNSVCFQVHLCMCERVCAFTSRARVVLFLCQSIEWPPSGDSWDDAIRALCVFA